ncbi:MAG: HAD hydrolase family protein, partial [Oscillospiraceae bacterium]|nr:HAD hydrolase family protein [Oscillospiraceae bacterium]
LMMAEPSTISAMLEEALIQFRGRVSVTCSKPYFLEFNPIGATKGITLSWAASYLHLPPSSFLAFGDSLNDLSMLQAAGRGVQMSNGREDLRSLCDDLCGSNQNDGVSAYLDKVFLEALS